MMGNEHLFRRRMSTHQGHGRGARECVVDGRREQSMSNTRVPAQASVDTSWMVVASSRWSARVSRLRLRPPAPVSGTHRSAGWSDGRVVVASTSMRARELWKMDDEPRDGTGRRTNRMTSHTDAGPHSSLGHPRGGLVLVRCTDRWHRHHPRERGSKERSELA